MTLVLSEEQTMLRDAARNFLGERAPLGHLRKLRDTLDAQVADTVSATCQDEDEKVA